MATADESDGDDSDEDKENNTEEGDNNSGDDNESSCDRKGVKERDVEGDDDDNDKTNATSADEKGDLDNAMEDKKTTKNPNKIKLPLMKAVRKEGRYQHDGLCHHLVHL